MCEYVPSLLVPSLLLLPDPEREPELQSAKDGSLFNMLWKSTHCSKLNMNIRKISELFFIILIFPILVLHLEDMDVVLSGTVLEIQDS